MSSTQNKEEKERQPPQMNRSMRQLSTAYAPGSLFTWEGGLGACISVVATAREASEVSRATRDAVREQIQEFLDSWFDRGMAGPYPDGAEPTPERLVDGRMIANGRPSVTEEKLSFVEANRVGYEPFPLAFVCRKCSLYKSSVNASTLKRDSAEFAKSCPERKEGRTCRNDWEQIDAVMAHWSGGVEPISPIRRRWDTNQGKVTEFSTCRGCGGRNFRLNRPNGQFSSWNFECMDCSTPREIRLADDFTLFLLGKDITEGRVGEVNMEPVSYRASSVFYPQSDRVLVFEDSTWLGKLMAGRELELRNFLGAHFGYPGRDLTDNERATRLRAAGRGNEWIAYEGLRQAAATLPQELRAGLNIAILDYEQRWKNEIFTDIDRGSALLSEQCSGRLKFVRRFDPIRMTVEHRTLSEDRLKSGRNTEDGKRACVDVQDPDQFLVTIDDDREAIVRGVQKSLALLGIAEMKLLRDLRVCDFSFGFTRVGSTPTIRRDEKARGALPVRLNMFGWSPRGGRVPVYCSQQSNEAFYVRLDEASVRGWLEANGMNTRMCPSERIGGLLIEDYLPFDQFLTAFRREKSVQRSAYPYAYTLLHTFAHQMIGVMSELSGLDIGSFGEHLFVPDLAFLVYRRGTTMDLGNLSSMWRNYADPEGGNGVLRRLLMPEALRCGSETICMTLRGGACPDCVMIPESACLTRNELLSRSVLSGGGVPTWDADRTELVGFRDIVLAQRPVGL